MNIIQEIVPLHVSTKWRLPLSSFLGCFHLNFDLRLMKKECKIKLFENSIHRTRMPSYMND